MLLKVRSTSIYSKSIFNFSSISTLHVNGLRATQYTGFECLLRRSSASVGLGLSGRQGWELTADCCTGAPWSFGHLTVSTPDPFVLVIGLTTFAFRKVLSYMDKSFFNSYLKNELSVPFHFLKNHNLKGSKSALAVTMYFRRCFTKAGP